jgi:hypothetical protein
MPKRRANNDIALIENLTGILLHCLIEVDSNHKKFQSDILNSLPDEVVDQIGDLLEEDKYTTEYVTNGIRRALDHLTEARPHPDGYDAERPADWIRQRPLLEKMTV